MTKEEFLERARQKHGYKYTYLNLKDKMLSSDSVEIMFNGKVYTQKVVKHILLGRCPEKSTDIKNNTQFISESKKIWGDKYDYSLVRYTGALNKVKIIYDGIVFEQLPISHLKGMSVEENYNTDFFIKKSKEKWGEDKYDYSLVKYINNKTKIKIVYRGIIYEQLPREHFTTSLDDIKIKIDNLDKFIDESNLIHYNKYSYEKVEYIKNKNKVIIICPIHGNFYQTPYSHLSGYGCKDCFGSKVEKDIINFLNKNNIDHIRKYKVYDEKELIFDFYIPSIRTCVEFLDIKYNDDEAKNRYCEDNYIELVKIKYNKTDYINEFLSNILFSKFKTICS